MANPVGRFNRGGSSFVIWAFVILSSFVLRHSSFTSGVLVFEPEFSKLSGLGGGRALERIRGETVAVAFNSPEQI